MSQSHTLIRLPSTDLPQAIESGFMLRNSVEVDGSLERTFAHA